VRLNNVSQLAGFSKRDDLSSFLRELCGAEYIHELLLAPTQELLDEYKKRNGDWEDYERRFLALMRERKVEEHTDRAL
jgi:primosomal protein N''